MNTPVQDHVAPTLPSIFDRFSKPATVASRAATTRQIAFRSALLAIPVATGLGWALRSRRAGVVAGSLTALALGAVRWQLSRWFTPTPAYEVEGQAGALELRRYPLRIEACAELDVADFERALDRGFGRLACYVFGANVTDEDLAMTTPAITTMHDGTYTMAFVMPPGRSIGSLPAPDDPRITLREAPERRVAVLTFNGRFTRHNVERHERELLRQVVDAGLVTRGSVGFAGYDSPATLPFLRRNEVWIEIV